MREIRFSRARFFDFKDVFVTYNHFLMYVYKKLFLFEFMDIHFILFDIALNNPTVLPLQSYIYGIDKPCDVTESIGT